MAMMPSGWGDWIKECRPFAAIKRVLRTRIFLLGRGRPMICNAKWRQTQGTKPPKARRVQSGRRKESVFPETKSVANTGPAKERYSVAGGALPGARGCRGLKDGAVKNDGGRRGLNFPAPG